MANPPSPTVRGRRLRYELKRLREGAGLTHADVARELEWSASKVSRIETGQSRAHPGDVGDLLAAYGMDDSEIKDGLVKLAREARRRGWWTRYGDVLGSGTYVGLEAEASGVRTYEPQIIPGLLQTEAYARASIEGGLIRPDPEMVERRVAARLARQVTMGQAQGPEIWAVLDEAVVRRPVGGADVMREQLRHLNELTTKPNAQVTLQILPLSIGAHPGMSGSFVLLSYSDPRDRPVVYLETATDGLFLEEQPDVERYTLKFNHLVARALGPEQSHLMITELADQVGGSVSN